MNITAYATSNPITLDQPVTVVCEVDPLPSWPDFNESVQYFVPFVSPFIFSMSNQSTTDVHFLDGRNNGVPSSLRGFCTPFIATSSGVIAGFGASRAFEVRVRGMK